MLNLEQGKKWDKAISCMEDVISKEPGSVDAYLSLQYLIMNLLVEERDYDGANSDHYVAILQKHFHEAYAKFSENPAYLYYTGRIAVMSEWYFDLEYDDVCRMIDKAGKLDPDNKIYQWNSYRDLNPWHFQNREKLRSYIGNIFNSDSDMRKELDAKGAVGAYVLSIMDYTARYMALHIRCLDEEKLNWSRALRAANNFILKCIQYSDFEALSLISNDSQSTLSWTDSGIESWKSFFSINDLKGYRECYKIMLELIKSYALKDDTLDFFFLKDFELVIDKDETVDPKYWTLWLQCVKDELKEERLV